MITVTSAAAKQIKISARQGNTEGLPLRIAAKRKEDGSIHYGMGFADEQHDNDVAFTSEDIAIVVSPLSLDYLSGTELDYVELENGKSDFIFKNPNDPNYKPAKHV